MTGRMKRRQRVAKCLPGFLHLGAMECKVKPFFNARHASCMLQRPSEFRGEVCGHRLLRTPGVESVAGACDSSK